MEATQIGENMNVTIVHETALSTKKAIDRAMDILRKGGDPAGFLEMAMEFQDQIMAETAEEYTVRPKITDGIPFLGLYKS